VGGSRGGHSVVRWLAVALAVVGCKGDDRTTTTVSASGSGSGSASIVASGAAAPSAHPAAITDDVLARNDALIAHIRELGTALAAAGTDCKQATAALVAATPAITAALTAVRDDGVTDAAANHWLDERNRAALAPDGDPFLAAGEQCKRDKAFMTAIKAVGLFGPTD